MSSYPQIVPGDFNHDGALDLLILTHTATPSHYDISLHYGSHTAYTSSQTLSNTSTSHVLVYDANNDLRLDLLGMNADGERAIWMNTAGADGTVEMTMTKQEVCRGDACDVLVHAAHT